MRWSVWGTFGRGQGQRGPIGLCLLWKDGVSRRWRIIHATWDGRGDGRVGRVGGGRSMDDSLDGGEDRLMVSTTV